MATMTTLPKTILITTLSATNSQNFIPKLGMKRQFSLVSSPIPLSLAQSPSIVRTKSPSPITLTNQNWIPATTNTPVSNAMTTTFGREFKYENVDDDDYDDYSEEQNQYSESEQPPRKRERLTHLTAEEKMYRRKLKNRIAAQTARDRKKALMVDLEEAVRRLEEENDALVNENSKLRHDQASLATENEKLKQLLKSEADMKDVKNENRDDTRSTSTVGPAEFINVPLPKEQVKDEWVRTWLLASALIQLCSTYCAKSLPEVEAMKVQLQKEKDICTITVEDVLRHSPSECTEKLLALMQFRNKPKQPP